MKRILFVLLIMTCSMSRAEWEVIGRSEDYVSYIDKSSVRKKGNFFEVWEMKDFFQAQNNSLGKNFRSLVFLNIYDCDNRISGSIAFATYSKSMGKGITIDSGDFGSNFRRDRVFPGSTAETTWKMVCGME
jgi:hypothetical protein